MSIDDSTTDQGRCLGPVQDIAETRGGRGRGSAVRLRKVGAGDTANSCADGNTLADDDCAGIMPAQAKLQKPHWSQATPLCAGALSCVMASWSCCISA